MAIRISKSEAEEISRGNEISANSIFKKFNYIFTPLIEKAKTNCSSLITKISSINDNYDINIKSSYYTFLENSLSKIYEISSNLLDCERKWNDVDPLWTSCRATDDNPLHKQKPNIKPASGKVRKYDFIAAYNFKSVLESLYAIVSELRSIEYSVYVNGYFKNDLSLPSTRPGNKEESYKDVLLVNENNITDISIFPNVSTRGHIFDFTDYIINNNTNGKQFLTPDELQNPNIANTELSNQITHGYVDPSVSLIPDLILNDLVGHQYYVNTNTDISLSPIGRQTVSHLLAPENTSKNILSYYNLPLNRSVDFDYTSDSISGITHQYLTLKPASTYKPTGQKSKLTNWTDVSSTISSFFHFKNDYSKNKILSKTSGYKQLIKADTVNELVKTMNQLFAKISATLCGEYFVYIENGPIEEYLSPLAGLGYPEFFSWYFSSKDREKVLNKSINWCNFHTSKPYEECPIPDGSLEQFDNRHDVFRERVGNLSNGNQIASEDYIGGEPTSREGRNKPIRAGLFYFDSINYDGERTLYDIDDFKDIASKSRSSFVPMTLNRYRIYKDIVTQKLSAGILDETDFKKHMVTNACLPYNTTISIVNNIIPETEISSTEKKILNRYCLSHPMFIEKYNEDYTGELSPFNVNTKYIFMPYMTYLQSECIENKSNYNGEIPKFNENNEIENTEISITSNEKYLNNAAGIPVLYEDRKNLWNRNRINVVPARNNALFSDKYCGTVQLHLYKNEKSTQGDPPIEINRKIYQDISKNSYINWFEYVISAATTINEVNHTHYGITKTIFNIPNNINHEVDLNYENELNLNNTYSNLYAQASNNFITSKLYVGTNLYTYDENTNNPEISNYLWYSTNDMLKMLYGKRFKFNDFYEDYHPFGKKIVEISAIAPYFLPGGSNKFVEGNATKVMSWSVSSSTNSSEPPAFTINNKIIQTTGKSACAGEVEASNVAQGNFFFTANQSNRLALDDESVEKDYYYEIVPQPDPIKVDSVEISSNNSFVLRGQCKHFWNDVSSVNVYLKDVQDEYSALLTHKYTYHSLNKEIRPYINQIPRTEISLTVNPNQNNIEYVKIKKHNSVPESNYYDISIDLPLNKFTPSIDDISQITDISCSLRFINENGGFRDICDTKDTTEITDGMFKIKIPSA